MESYTTPEVSKIVGISQRKLISYVERGYVASSIQDAAGHGTKRLWSYEDIIRVAAVRYLTNFLSVDAIRDIANRLKHEKMITEDQVMFVLPEEGMGLVPVTITVPKGEDPYTLLGPKVRAKNPISLVLVFRDLHDWVQSKLEG